MVTFSFSTSPSLPLSLSVPLSHPLFSLPLSSNPLFLLFYFSRFPPLCFIVCLSLSLFYLLSQPSLSYLLAPFLSFSQIGTQVLQLTVLDNVTHVRYQLINVHPSDNDFFLSPNGSLLIARLLDRNRISTYSLTVSARNTRPVSAHSYAVVVVTVTDGVFPEPEVSLRLFGNESVGQSLCTISASSTAGGSPFRYNIIGDGGDGLFVLNSTTGRLSLSSTLPNYDYRLQYRLVIEGQSVTNPLLYGDLIVTLWAEPVDGGAGGFAQDEYFFVVSNETHVGEVFGYVSLFGCNVSNETSMAAVSPSINYTISNVSGERERENTTSSINIGRGRERE